MNEVLRREFELKKKQLRELDLKADDSLTAEEKKLKHKLCLQISQLKKNIEKETGKPVF
jgi:hypothetical protein